MLALVGVVVTAAAAAAAQVHLVAAAVMAATVVTAAMAAVVANPDRPALLARLAPPADDLPDRPSGNIRAETYGSGRPQGQKPTRSSTSPPP